MPIWDLLWLLRKSLPLLETCFMILSKSVLELIMAFFGISAGRRAVMGSHADHGNRLEEISEVTS